MNATTWKMREPQFIKAQYCS